MDGERKGEMAKKKTPKIEFAPGAVKSMPPGLTPDDIIGPFKRAMTGERTTLETGPIHQAARMGGTFAWHAVSESPSDRSNSFLILCHRDLNRIIYKANKLGLAGTKISGVCHGLDGQPNIEFIHGT